MVSRSPISVDRGQSDIRSDAREVLNELKALRHFNYKSVQSSYLKGSVPGGRTPIVPDYDAPVLQMVSRTKRVRYTEPFQGYRRSLMPVQQWADAPLIGPVSSSLAGHCCLLLLLLMHFHPKMQGTKMSQSDPQANAMEVVFTPPSHNEMSGQPSPSPGGGTPPPAPSKPKKPKKQQSQAALTVPEDQSSEGEIEVGKQADKKKETKSSKHEPERKPEHRRDPAKQVQDAKDNPFAHPTNISFPNNEPAPARRPGRRGGNGRAIDLSNGPLSLNGQINAPYKSTTSVKGVSSEYGEEIDRWIREHLYYPDEAIQNGEEGPASVHVVLDRQGHVSRVVLSSQSGSYDLDSATVAMFQSAQLPPAPPDVKGDHFDIDVTVNYILLR